MRESLTVEEKQKLVELKLRLLNAKKDEERVSLLEAIERILKTAKKRQKFIATLDRP
ncbi:hypothetical protein M3172_22380 [Mesobacillus subterraneus]|uniref:hypothetical protein n=1 Tax=Mesobacillus subterraneus TaxID=285983 RepID=UPI00203F050A|nr:hypothetical protein [Mesobacillus subterraneus]MCM3575921.1 hypothetical protein [Mesobacillus subterraneus]